MTRFVRTVCAVAMLVLFASGSHAQSSTGSISGVITDQNQAVIPAATITIRNTATGFTRSTTTNSEGRYSFTDLPLGAYEVIVEASTFSKYIQTGIRLLVNQNAIVSPSLTPAVVNEVVNVNSDASLLNRTTPEVATRFDERRLSELPSAPNRSVFNVLLSVPGVSQLGSGQAAFAVGISFSANGGRLRSNSFLLDGQDMNDPVLTGIQMPLNTTPYRKFVLSLTSSCRNTDITPVRS